MPGPVPNRSEDLARPRERKGGNVAPITKGIALTTAIPEPDPEWHPIARMLWDGMASSGQRDFYQNSDWAYAYSLCDDLSNYKSQSRRSAQMLAAINSAMERLLITEGDRRRVRVELSPPADPDATTAGATAVEDYKRGLSLVPDLAEDDE